MKETPIIFNTEMVKAILDGRKTMTRRVVKPCSTATVKGKDGKTEQPDWVFTLAKCPYGQVSDRLWVRETWATCGALDRWKPILLLHDEHIAYKATTEYPHQYTWRPSIFMPRWASRILLEITGLRAERLQEITEEDCKAEGVQYLIYPNESRTWEGEFERLWNSLNAKRGYGWETNPWVWVIKFDNIGIRNK